MWIKRYEDDRRNPHREIVLYFGTLSRGQKWRPIAYGRGNGRMRRWSAENKVSSRFHQAAVRESTACTVRLAPVWRPLFTTLSPILSDPSPPYPLSLCVRDIRDERDTLIKTPTPRISSFASRLLFFLTSVFLSYLHSVHFRKVNIDRIEKLIMILQNERSRTVE